MRPQGIHMEDFGIGSYEFWGCRGCDVNWQLVDDDDECYDPQYPYYYEDDNGYEHFIKDDDTFHWLVERYPEFYVADEEDDDYYYGTWKGYRDGDINSHYNELGIHEFVYDSYFPEGATY